MKFIIAATVYSVIALGIADAKPNQGRILEGEEARPGQFPYQVSIQFLGRHNCGGAILNKNWIVTAGHCIADYKPEHLIILTGINKLSEKGDKYKPTSLHVHEEYDGFEILNDIGMIYLSTPIEFTTRVQPVPMHPEFISGDVPLTVCGWGSTELGGDTPDDLQFVNVFSVDQKECQERHQPFIVDGGMICTYTKPGQGTCHGDSGSPLTFNNSIVGIVSWGRPCAKGYPDVFTRVSYFRKWIVDTMNNIIQ